MKIRRISPRTLSKMMEVGYPVTDEQLSEVEYVSFFSKEYRERVGENIYVYGWIVVPVFFVTVIILAN